MRHSAQLISATRLCLYGNGLSEMSTQLQIAECHLTSVLSACLYLGYVLFMDRIFSSSCNPAPITLFFQFPLVLDLCFSHRGSCNVVVSNLCRFKWLSPTDYLTSSIAVCLFLTPIYYLRPSPNTFSFSSNITHSHCTLFWRSK